MLEEAWRVLEDAGYKFSDVSGTNTGMFIGITNFDYNELLGDSGVNLDAYTATGTYFCVAANRISYFLNIHGPSVIVDTACSSSPDPACGGAKPGVHGAKR